MNYQPVLAENLANLRTRNIISIIKLTKNTRLIKKVGNELVILILNSAKIILLIPKSYIY